MLFQELEMFRALEKKILGSSSITSIPDSCGVNYYPFASVQKLLWSKEPSMDDPTDAGKTLIDNFRKINNSQKAGYLICLVTLLIALYLFDPTLFMWLWNSIEDAHREGKISTAVYIYITL